MEVWKILGWGAVGGICPTLSKLAASYTSNPHQDMPVLGVYVGLALFAVLGAIIARGFATGEVKAALVAGIAAPAIVTNVVAGFEKPAQQPVGDDTAFLQFIAPAQAQEVTLEMLPVAVDDPRVVTVTPMLQGGGEPTTGGVTFEWQTDGTVSSNVMLGGQLSTTVEQAIRVPPGAESLTIGGQTIPMTEIADKDYTLDLLVWTQPTLGGDLLWALGAKRSFQLDSVEVK